MRGPLSFQENARPSTVLVLWGPKLTNYMGWMRGLVLYWPGGKPASIGPHKRTQPPIQGNFTLSLRGLMTLCVAIPENSSPLPHAFNSSQQAFRCYAKPLRLLNNSQQGKVPCLPPLLLGIVLPLVLVMAEYSTFLWTAATLEGTLGNHSQQGHRMASSPGRGITLPGLSAQPPAGLPAPPCKPSTLVAAWSPAHQRGQRNREPQVRAPFEVSPSNRMGSITPEITAWDNILTCVDKN